MDEQIDYPLPDPAWDYYLPWHALHAAKAQIDHALKFMAEIESANTESDQTMREILTSAISIINKAVPPDEPT